MGNLSSCRGSSSATQAKQTGTLVPVVTSYQPAETNSKKNTSLSPRRRMRDSLQLLAINPFLCEENTDIRFTHLIFQENELERQVKEGLEKLGTSLNNGEYFNIPTFLKKYANNFYGVKILLHFNNSNYSKRKLTYLPEAAYLIDQVKFLHMIYIGHPHEKGDPYIVLKESHGNKIKNKIRKSVYRKLLPRVKIIKKKDFVIIVGKDFMLNLEPPGRDSLARDFPDGNGERPIAVGHYTRMLDTHPDAILEWNAYIYDWYNTSHKLLPFEREKYQLLKKAA